MSFRFFWSTIISLIRISKKKSLTGIKKNLSKLLSVLFYRICGFYALSGLCLAFISGVIVLSLIPLYLSGPQAVQRLVLSDGKHLLPTLRSLYDLLFYD